MNPVLSTLEALSYKPPKILTKKKNTLTFTLRIFTDLSSTSTASLPPSAISLRARTDSKLSSVNIKHFQKEEITLRSKVLSVQRWHMLACGEEWGRIQRSGLKCFKQHRKEGSTNGFTLDLAESSHTGRSKQVGKSSMVPLQTRAGQCRDKF